MTMPQATVTIRRARPEDSAVCGQICYDAFLTINRTHNFPCDFPEPAVAVGVISTMFSAPEFYCVVAESGGHIVGSNCMDERSMIAGIGPITVDPQAQSAGIGRALMRDVIERARERRVAGVRLVQAAFHNRSLSLYTSLGFDVQEPLACMQGQTQQRSIAGCSVRGANSADMDACNALSYRVHGFERGIELEQSIQAGVAKVVERDGRITGYATGLAFFAHATAETNPDMKALIASAESFGGPGILVPTRNSDLFRWCVANGLRIVQPMTLMSMGLYNQPAGAFLPSVMF